MTGEEDAHYQLVEGALEAQAVGGYLEVPDAPGLGVVLDDTVISRYPRLRVS